MQSIYLQKYNNKNSSDKNAIVIRVAYNVFDVCLEQ